MTNFFQPYIKLLKYNKYLQTIGTRLREKDRDKYGILLNYGVILSDHIHWQYRIEYLKMMKNFVKFEITGEEFVNQFTKLHELNEKTINNIEADIEKLKLIEPNPKCFGFTEWTSEIDLGCDEFYPDFEPQDKVEFSFARDEENLRTFVADILPQIQKYQ